MAATLADLLKYKEEVDIVHPVTGEFVKKVWVRILGDQDLTYAYKKARLASAAKRRALRDPETEDYQDEVLGVIDLSKEEQIDFIKTANMSQFVSEAQAIVVRPDLPKLEEVAKEPDAASLEELEALDKKEDDDEEDYIDKIDEYINLRAEELEGRLRNMSDEELLKTCQFEVSNLVPFTMFLTELNDWKAFLGTYSDEACRIKEFETIEDFRQLPKPTKEFIIANINRLEIDGPTIKN